MDAFARSFGKLFLPVVSLILSVAPTTNSVAGGHGCHSCEGCGYYTPCCPFIDCCTLSAWHRTWHTPNSVFFPLRSYYIPRTMAGCDDDGCMAEGEGTIGDCYVTEWPAASEECASGYCPGGLAIEPRGMERLGQIPIDMTMGVGVATPPNRAAR